ncbi:serine protease [Sorangium sp. So ce136]|uniref:trypsin-like serine peptidase n=1 Tax=Sorangium sp. So ce136 TaxID=3133284 RepID=UPI003F098E8C
MKEPRGPNCSPAEVGMGAESLKARLHLDHWEIWGDDGRRNPENENEAGVKAQIDAVALLVHRDVVSVEHDGSFRLRTRPLRERYNACDNVKFLDEPVVDDGGVPSTCFLLSDRVVATAGHCVPPENVDELLVIFGYRMNGGAATTSFSPANVRRVRRVIDARLDVDTGEDWALLELERPVPHVKPLARLRSTAMRVSEPVYVIGYPLGLPVKYALDARVRDVQPLYFHATLDTFEGNSGSPVLDAHGEVAGIFVRGDEFLPWSDTDCRRPLLCQEGGSCLGERVIPSSLFAHRVPR